MENTGSPARTSQCLSRSADLVRAGLPAVPIAASATIRCCSVCQVRFAHVHRNGCTDTNGTNSVAVSCTPPHHRKTSVAPRDVPADQLTTLPMRRSEGAMLTRPPGC